MENRKRRIRTQAGIIVLAGLLCLACFAGCSEIESGLKSGADTAASFFQSTVKSTASAVSVYGREIYEALSGDAASSSETAAPAGECWGDTGISGVTVYEYGKTLLATNERRDIYDKIAEAVKNVEGSVTVQTSLKPDIVETIYRYYTSDHTENFYLLGDVNVSYTYYKNNSEDIYKSYTFSFSYLYDKATVDKMRSDLAGAAGRYLGSLKGGTDISKEKSLHDKLIRSVQYNTAAAENPGSDPLSYTAYGAIVNGSAVCDGYAKAMKLLLDSAGIRSLYVSGTAFSNSGSGEHAWNIANVSEKWYYLDATFDDSNTVDYTYFNFTESSNHILGTFDNSDPFSKKSENYAVMPTIG